MSRREQLSVGELTVDRILNTGGVEIFPGYRQVFAGLSASETDADASVVITKTGVLSTDFAVATLVAGTTAQAVTKVACTTDTVTVSLAGNGGAGTILFYTVFRAV
jgi:hypothetical protein